MKVKYTIKNIFLISTLVINELLSSYTGDNKLQIILTTGEKVEVSSRQSVKFKNWNSL